MENIQNKKMQDYFAIPFKRNRATLLLVDEEEGVLSALKRLLRKDYDLLLATNGEDALHLLEKNHVDLIMAGQRMPAGMTGVEFLKRAKVLKPKVVRIVLSGYMDAESMANAVNEGAIYKFFLKPWDDEQLKESLKDACRYKALIDDNLMLTQALQEKNQELAAANALLEKGLAKNQKALHLLHEVFALLPWPLVGVDENLMIASTNEAAEALFSKNGIFLLGESAAVLPFDIFSALKNKEEKRLYLKINNKNFALDIKKIDDHAGARGFLLLFLEKPQ